MSRTAWIALFAPVVLSTFACGGGQEDGGTLYGEEGVSTIGNEAGTEDPTASDDPSGNEDPTSDDDPSGNETGIKLDTLPDGNEMSSGGNEEGGGPGCTAIDFLFVIDNSGSMGDNQQNLIASFPGFIDKIQETIADVDSYHVMVVKTDEYWNDCSIECAFFPFACSFGDVNACDGSPSVCDDTLGAGVNFPIGEDASNQYCALTGGQRYITPEEPLAQLPQRFTCVASVGTDGDSDERPMESLTAALSDNLNGPGGCNSGFLRDEAVLVVTIITDEEDNSSPGTPPGWYQNVVAQKGSDEGVVVLGLINDTDAGNPICPVESDDPARIREFVHSFPNQITGSVCEANYAPFFEQAVDLINTTCDEYEPIG